MTALHRVALTVLMVSSVVVGVWAQVFPRSFYDDFPGAGQVWVAVDGPYNEHLIRDVGGLNLGLALVALIALTTGSLLVARTAGGAVLVFGLPHLAYHATHLDGLATVDIVGNLVALALTVVAAALALAAPRARGPAPPGAQEAV